MANFSASDSSRVNETTEGFQVLHSISSLPEGGYVVRWSTIIVLAPGEFGAAHFEQRYDAAGQKVGGETAVQGLGPTPQDSDRVLLPDGSYVKLTAEGFGSFSAQQFDANDVPLGDPIVLGGASRGWDFSAALLPDGSVAVAWQPVSSIGPGEIFTALLDDTTAGTSGPDNLVGSNGPDALQGFAGADVLAGLGGDDLYDGGAGVDQAVIATTVAGVQSHSFVDGVLTVTSAGGTDTLVDVERVSLNDALFALHTEAPSGDAPGGDAWEAAALLRAAFGTLPGMSDLSRWTAVAEQSSDMADLANDMIEFYAPGISSAALVTHLYIQLLDVAPSPKTVQAFVAQIGPGKTFETQAELFVFAALRPENTDAMVGFTGTVQQLDPSWFLG